MLLEYFSRVPYSKSKKETFTGSLRCPSVRLSTPFISRWCKVINIKYSSLWSLEAHKNLCGTYTVIKRYEHLCIVFDAFSMKFAAYSKPIGTRRPIVPNEIWQEVRTYNLNEGKKLKSENL